MAVPSRVYVGVVVFGLITSLSLLAYVVLLLGGYEPPPSSPAVPLFPEQHVRGGDVLFLAIAGLFSIAFTVFAWRSLLAGARRDAAKRKRREKLHQELRAYQRQRQRRGPPGFN